jgi:hypothetical protein
MPAPTGPALVELQQAGMRGLRAHQCWLTAGPEIGNFGRNHALRASIAYGGLGALEPTDAICLVRFKDEQELLLNGLRSHVLRVPPAGLPVDGQLFFVDNPMQRYELGDRTPGLVFEADGSLDMFLGHEAPADPVRRLGCFSFRCDAICPVLRCGVAGGFPPRCGLG